MSKKTQPIIFCLDLEGVLIPEIWIEVARRFKNEKLRLTTRDIPDYDKLMRYRLEILRKENIKLKDIQNVIRGMKPLPGGKAFLDKLRTFGPVMILSDTYYEFANPLLVTLNHPVLFCNSLVTDSKGFIKNYTIRIRDGKKKAVHAFHQINFRVHAAGDSYNDLSMILNADKGVLFNPPSSIQKEYPRVPVAKTHQQLLKALTA